MGNVEDDKSKGTSDKYIPPPMDPYARYQTPYERRPSDDQNPFIEFRRFADRQLSSIFENFGNFPKMLGMSDEIQKMRDHADTFRDEMQKHIEELSLQRQKMLEDMLKNARDQGANKPPVAGEPESTNAAAVASSSPMDSAPSLPEGWVQATTRDGKSYYIDANTGTATLDLPTTDLSPLPTGWETQMSKMGRPYYINHNDRSTTWKDPREIQQDMEKSPLSSEERREKWRRGFRNCPALKKQKDETELSMYESLEQQHQDSEDTQHDSRAAQWARGFKNCPKLKNLQIDDQTELSMYERLDEQSTHVSYPTKSSCRWDNQRSQWSWLPILGHDGMQRARQIPLSSSGEVISNSDPLPVEYHVSDTDHMDPVSRNDHVVPWLLLSPYSPFNLSQANQSSIATVVLHDGEELPVEVISTTMQDSRGTIDPQNWFETSRANNDEVARQLAKHLPWADAFEDLLSVARTGEMADHHSNQHTKSSTRPDHWLLSITQRGSLGSGWGLDDEGALICNAPSQAFTKWVRQNKTDHDPMFQLLRRFERDLNPSTMAHDEEAPASTAAIKRWNSKLDGCTDLDSWPFANKFPYRPFFGVGLHQHSLPSLWEEFEHHSPESIISAVDHWAQDDPEAKAFRESNKESMNRKEHNLESQIKTNGNISEWAASHPSPFLESSTEEEISSIVSTMTKTTSKTLLDGSVETRRVLRKRFADGREESEESTDVSHSPKSRASDGETAKSTPASSQNRKSGWFWN